MASSSASGSSGFSAIAFTDHPAPSLVQRTVLINSFAFTLLIARADSVWPCPEFEQWIKVFTSGYPAAKPGLEGWVVRLDAEPKG